MNLEWLNEKIPKLENGNWLYNLVCFLLGKRKEKLSYREYMMLLYGLNRKKRDEEKAKKLAIIKALDVYKGLHEGELPKEDE